MNDAMFAIMHEFDAVGSILMMGKLRLQEAKSPLVSAEAEPESTRLMPESLAAHCVVLESQHLAWHMPDHLHEWLDKGGGVLFNE